MTDEPEIEIDYPVIQNSSNSSIMHAFWPADDSWVSMPSLANTYQIHADMYRLTYGPAPSPPLSIVWIPANSSAPRTYNPERTGLDPQSVRKYQALSDRLAEVAQLDEPPVDRGAIKSADEVLRQLVHYKIQPPMISWHGGDAIVMLWRLGETNYAMTVTDGELGFVVRAERKTVRRQDSIGLNNIKYLVGK